MLDSLGYCLGMIVGEPMHLRSRTLGKGEATSCRRFSDETAKGEGA